MNTGNLFQSAWFDRFRNWPTLPGRSVLPDMDGDIAWLHHLENTIFEQRPHNLATAPRDFIYHQTVDATWINPDHLRWPTDAHITRLITEWKWRTQ
jgi:hypothetical protein